MKTSIYDTRQNIFELQSMLREISHLNDNVRLINPDSLFGPETTQAVKQVQQLAGIPITGDVDLLTWNTIVSMLNNK